MPDSFEDMLHKAKLKLILQHPEQCFPLAVLRQLRIHLTDSVPFAATDGLQVHLNPDTLMKHKVTVDQLGGLLLHEAYHVVLDHLVRRKEHNWNPAVANAAGDYVINLMLTDHGIQIPEGGLLDERFRGMGTREVYDLLISEGYTPPGTMVLDIIFAEKGDEQTAQEIKDILVKAVLQTDMMYPGKDMVDAGVRKMVKELLEPKLPWQAILSNRCHELANSGYNYAKRSRRFLSQESIYEPARESVRMGKVFVAMDVSGSITEDDEKEIWSEIRSIWDILEPLELQVVTFDTRIRDERTWAQGEFLEPFPAHGGGGTSITPVWEAMDAFDPVFALVFTDGHIAMRSNPSKNVTEDILWIVSDPSSNFNPPLGEVIFTE
jgi:predicted metal-dependent peptidase